jgi:membrane carboxypeptidase/penicillin-binding protein
LQRHKFNHVIQAWRQPGSTFSSPSFIQPPWKKASAPASRHQRCSRCFSMLASRVASPGSLKNYDGTFVRPYDHAQGLGQI